MFVTRKVETKHLLQARVAGTSPGRYRNMHLLLALVCLAVLSCSHIAGHACFRQRDYEHARTKGEFLLPTILLEPPASSTSAGTTDAEQTDRETTDITPQVDDAESSDVVTQPDAAIAPDNSDTTQATPDTAARTPDVEATTGTRKVLQRAQTARAMLLASVGGPSIDTQDEVVEVTELTESNGEHVATNDEVNDAAAEAATAAAEAAAMRDRALAAQVAFNAVVNAAVKPRPTRVSDAESVIDHVLCAAEVHSDGSDTFGLPFSRNVKAVGGVAGADTFKTCAASRARDPAYRAAVRDHLKWRQFNRQILGLKSGAIGSSPVITSSKR